MRVNYIHPVLLGFNIGLIPTSTHHWTIYFLPTTVLVYIPSSMIEQLSFISTLMKDALIVADVYKMSKLSAKVHLLVFAVLLSLSVTDSAGLFRWSSLYLLLSY